MALVDTLQALSASTFDDPTTVLRDIVIEICTEAAAAGLTTVTLNKDSIKARANKQDNWFKYQNRQSINWTTVIQSVITYLQSEGITVQTAAKSITLSW